MDIRTKVIFRAVEKELERAESRFGPYKSAHEGWAVINEEMDELWEEVRRNPKKIKIGWFKRIKIGFSEGFKGERELQKEEHVRRMREEALQVAVTAIRFIKDVC